MRVMVIGGVAFQDTVWLHTGLDLLHSKAAITEIIEGGQPGAAVRAYEWAQKRGVPCTTVPIEWERHSRGLKHGQQNPALSIRDTRMAQMKPDVVLVCPGTHIETIKVLAAHGLRPVKLDKMPVYPSTENPLAA